MAFRSGFISIIGRPNAGKSTLLNRITGEKISIVSPKPQTTRNSIRGVFNRPECQIVFIDTPGIHKGKGLLNEFMVREAVSSLSDVDAVVLLIDAQKPVSDDDRLVLEAVKGLSCPVVLGVNKVDGIDKRLLLPVMDEYSRAYSFREIIPISALKGDGVELLVKTLISLMPEGPKYFPDDSVTDLPERFIAAEMVREKVFLYARDEVPYSAAVTVEKFTEKKDLISISATICVERESQKGIIIGKGGSMLKKIGSSARAEIEGLLGKKVFLELFVKVSKEWTRKPDALKDFGY